MDETAKQELGGLQTESSVTFEKEGKEKKGNSKNWSLFKYILLQLLPKIKA